MSNFHPLEVVGRASDSQLQVGENLMARKGVMNQHILSIFWISSLSSVSFTESRTCLIRGKLSNMEDMLALLS